MYQRHFSDLNFGGETVFHFLFFINFFFNGVSLFKALYALMP